MIRAHTLGVSTGGLKSYQAAAGSDQFNFGALESIDYALSQGAKLGLRFIIPLTDNYNYYHGGYHDFVDYQVEQANGTDLCNPFPKRLMSVDDSCRAFFDSNATDGLGHTTIAGFKKYVSSLLNHRNKYSGLLLKDDPAVLAWETGNELFIKGEPFYNWTAKIATFIKQTVGE